jgi:hypothetical protein
MDICTHLKYTLKLLICSWGKLLEALAFSSQDCILLYNGFYSFFFSSKTAFSSLVKFLVVLFNSLYLMLTGEGHAWRWTLDKASASWWKRCGFRVYLKMLLICWCMHPYLCVAWFYYFLCSNFLISFWTV